MLLRSMMRAFIKLLVLGVAAGGFVAYWWWSRGDEFLRQSIINKCRQVAPEWQVDIHRARFDWHGQVRLDEVQLRTRNDPALLLTLPELVIRIDRELFASRHEIRLEHVRILEPVVHLRRDRNGRWNWSDLPALPKPAHGPVECEVLSGTVRMRLEQPNGRTRRYTAAENVVLQFTPTGNRQLSARGSAQLEHVGNLSVDARLDLESKSWQLKGRIRQVPLGRSLFELAAQTVPQVESQLAQIATRMETWRSFGGDFPFRSPARPVQVATTTNDPPPQPAGARSSTTPPPIPPSAVPELGIEGQLDLQFDLARTSVDAEPTYRIWGDLRQGAVTNPVLPFPLRGVTAKVYWDGDRLAITNAAARNGTTRLNFDAQLNRRQMVPPDRMTVSIRDMLLDDRLRSRLPANLVRAYDLAQPSGIVDVECTFREDGRGGWMRESMIVTARDCSVRHRLFPYTVDKVQGKVEQHGERLKVNLQGRAGQRSVSCEGIIAHMRPGAEYVLDIHADGVPIDDKLLSACPDPTRRTLEALRLQGLVDLHARLHRPEGIGRKTHVDVTAYLKSAALQYDKFPYQVTGLSGTVVYSSRQKHWSIQDLKGYHNEAVLTGSGTYSSQEPPGRLDLLISARQAYFDRELRASLPQHLRTVWDQLLPTGRFDVITDVSWVRGQPAVVSLPRARVYDAGLRLEAFPYELRNVAAELSFENGVAEISQLTASHDQTTIQAKAAVRCLPEDGWQVRLSELSVDRLEADQEFRRALPSQLRSFVEALNPRGPLSLSGTLEFRRPGDANKPVESDWDLRIGLADVTIDAGLEIKRVQGRATAFGRWDGRRVDNSGRFDFNSLEVLQHRIEQVQGPYVLRDRELVIGSSRLLGPEPENVAAEERVVGRFANGFVTLDCIVLLNRTPVYNVLVTLSQGSLSDYAQRYLRGAKNVRGVMNGWVTFQGRGNSADGVSGRGQLAIRPAALYELPIAFQIFKVLALAPDNTAFREATLDFSVARRQFDFRQIDLIGDAINMRGRGSIGFDETVALNFYSMLSRNQLPIPVIKPLLDQATKGWVGVTVDGTLDSPHATYKAVPSLDETMKQFLSAFGKPPATGLPRLMMPPLIIPQRPSVPRNGPLMQRR